MIKFKDILTESIIQIDELETIIAANIDLKGFKFTKSPAGLRWTLNARSYDIDISVYNNVLPVSTWIGCNARVETSSTSLANPKLSYQNTSARRVTNKKINIRESADDIKSLIKILNRFKSNLQKYNINLNVSN